MGVSKRFLYTLLITFSLLLGQLVFVDRLVRPTGTLIVLATKSQPADQPGNAVMSYPGPLATLTPYIPYPALVDPFTPTARPTRTVMPTFTLPPPP